VPRLFENDFILAFLNQQLIACAKIVAFANRRGNYNLAFAAQCRRHGKMLSYSWQTVKQPCIELTIGLRFGAFHR
jgi:hypothetical protein